MRSAKVLITILVVLAVIFISVVVYVAISDKNIGETFKRKNQESSQEKTPEITVSDLTDDKEVAIGTIIYPGVDKVSEIQALNDTKIATFEVTDSVDGAANIYYQDLYNRYLKYNVEKKEITKQDALDKKAIQITCTGETGKITITVWGKTNGMTVVQIQTSTDFK